MDMISFRIPRGAIGEPKTTVSSIEVILRWGSSFLKVAMTGKGSSIFKQVSSHLLVFMDSPIFSSSLKRKRRSSKTIWGMSARFESFRYQIFSSLFRLLTI